jgi:hypothetical protein
MYYRNEKWLIVGFTDRSFHSQFWIGDDLKSQMGHHSRSGRHQGRHVLSQPALQHQGELQDFRGNTNMLYADGREPSEFTFVKPTEPQYYKDIAGMALAMGATAGVAFWTWT